MASPSVTATKILLVEGTNDKHVIEHLCRQAHLSLNFEVKACGNIDQLLNSIPVQVKAPDRTVVGVLADANANVSRRWRDIARKFSRVDVQLPGQAVSGGVILQSNPRVGVWLMPDNTSQGELEDFLKVLIPGNDHVWSLAQGYISSIPSAVQPRKLSKAEVHAWLAGKPELLPMGAAVGKGQGYFNTNTPLAQSLIRWLDQLFR